MLDTGPKKKQKNNIVCSLLVPEAYDSVLQSIIILWSFTTVHVK